MKNPYYKRKNCKFIDATDEILKSYNEAKTPKRHRIKLTDDQLETLEKSFVKCQHPSSSVKEKIALDLYIPIKNVQIWFQNRRARNRTEKEMARNEYEKKYRNIDYMDMILNEEKMVRYDMERLYNNATPTWYEDRSDYEGNEFYENFYNNGYDDIDNKNQWIRFKK